MPPSFQWLNPNSQTIAPTVWIGLPKKGTCWGGFDSPLTLLVRTQDGPSKYRCREW